MVYLKLTICDSTARTSTIKFRKVKLVQKVIRAAVYCRVSTEDQSCERQERDLLEYAQQAGYQVVGVWKENESGKKDNRVERSKVLGLAQARKINTVLVTELTRWGRSRNDLLDTLEQLAERKVSLVAQTGLTFDLSTAQGKLIAAIMAALAEFEHDLLRERIRSGMAAAKAKGQRFGRKPGHYKADPLEPLVIELSHKGNSYRAIASELKISKTTVNDIMQRYRRKLISG